jgi:hypothetical protein
MLIAAVGDGLVSLIPVGVDGGSRLDRSDDERDQALIADPANVCPDPALFPYRVNPVVPPPPSGLPERPLSGHHFRAEMLPPVAGC